MMIPLVIIALGVLGYYGLGLEAEPVIVSMMALAILVLYFKSLATATDINILSTEVQEVAEAAISTVQGRISKAINEAVETTQQAQITAFTNEIKVLKGNSTLAISTEIEKMKVEFEMATKEFFSTNLDNHIQKSQESIKDLQGQKVELKESFNKLHAGYLKLEESENQLYDKLIDPYSRLLLNAYEKGLKFYSLPDSDPDFDSYLCQSTNSFHKVPKDFSKWKASDTSMNLNFLYVNYVNIDTGDSIPVPAELLHIIKNVEGQPLTRAIESNGNGNGNTYCHNIPGPDRLNQEPFDPLTCPVCDKPFTDPLYTRQHIDQKQDQEHINYRADNPGYADYLTAAIQEESRAPLTPSKG